MSPKAEFPDYFREIQVKFSRFYAHTLNKANLSLSQYALLNQLATAGPIPMTEVGEKLHITKPAVTHLVDRLEKNKFLKRLSHPHDRRVYLLKISPKGMKLTRRIQEQVLNIVAETLKHFSADERQTIIRYQKLVSKTVDQVLNQAKGNK